MDTWLDEPSPATTFAAMIVAFGAIPRYCPQVLLRPFPAAMSVVVVP